MIGKKLRALMKLKDIKQIRLAEHLGISPSRLSNYLADKREPDFDMLEKIACYLSVDLNYFADCEFSIQSNMPKPMSEGVVYIKRLMTNSKRLSSADQLAFPKSQAFPSSLLCGLDIEQLLMYEAHTQIGSIAKQGDYLIVEPFTPKSARSGDLMLFRARNYKLVKLYINEGEYMFAYDNTIEKAYELDKYDIVRLIIHRL